MSIDRRIISILYKNGITDVEKVQDFLGDKNNYYQIRMDNKIYNLQIPGRYYPNDEIIVEEQIIGEDFIVEDVSKCFFNSSLWNI